MDYKYYKNLYKKNGLTERELYIRYNNLVNEKVGISDISFLNTNSGGSISNKYLKIKFKESNLFKTSEVGENTIYKLKQNQNSFLNTTLLFSPELGILVNYTDSFFPVVLIDNMNKLYNKLVSLNIDERIINFTYDPIENYIIVDSGVYYKNSSIIQKLYKDFLTNRFEVENISGNQLQFKYVYLYIIQSLFINDKNINNNTYIEISDVQVYFETTSLMFEEKLFNNIGRIGTGNSYYIENDEVLETKMINGANEFLMMFSFILKTHFGNYIDNILINNDELIVGLKRNVYSLYFLDNSVFSDPILYDYIFNNIIEYEIIL